MAIYGIIVPENPPCTPNQVYWDRGGQESDGDYISDSDIDEHYGDILIPNSTLIDSVST